MATAANASPPGPGRPKKTAFDGAPSLLYPGHWLLPPPIWRESRLPAEFARLTRDPVFQGEGVPHGDGGPVLLIPGFMAGDQSFLAMYDWLRRLGYAAELPGIHFNIRYSEVMVKRLTVRLVDLYGWMGEKVTVIGHSRGGLLGKVLAHRHPEMVSQLIALGSPLADPYDVHPLTLAGVRMAQLLNVVRYGHSATVERRFLRDLAAPARLPMTSVYSRSDGIVHWAACVRPDMNCIEVESSHVGLGVNPAVYREVARLLATPLKTRGRGSPR